MRRVALLLTCLFPLLAGCPGTDRDLGQPPYRDAEAPPPDAPLEIGGDPVEVTVMNWNVRDLFNDVRDSPEIAATDELVVSAGAYQAKLAAIAGVIQSAGADIAVLQEVENEAVTSDLAAAAGGFEHQAVTQGNDPRGIDIALLSKHPIDRVVSHKDEYFTGSGQTFRYARDVLEAHLFINGRHVVLLGVHLKAQADTESQQKRLAEAENTRKIATSLLVDDPDAAIIVLGDFNDTPDSPPLLTFTDAAQYAFESAGARVPSAERYSYIYGSSRRLIDDQLLSATSVELLLLDSPRIRHDIGAGPDTDHYPLLVDYAVR